MSKNEKIAQRSWTVARKGYPAGTDGMGHRLAVMAAMSGRTVGGSSIRGLLKSAAIAKAKGQP